MSVYIPFFILLLPVTLLLRCFLKKRTPKKSLILWIIVGFVITASMLFYIAIEQSKRRVAEQLDTLLLPTINAIEKYETVNGYYPVNLEELVPVFMTYLPTPSSDKELYYDAILYEPKGKNSKYSPKFLDASPDFTFVLFTSYSIAGEKLIQYCPIRFTCRYEVDFPEQIGNKVVIEKMIINPDRIDSNWIYVESY